MNFTEEHGGSTSCGVMKDLHQGEASRSTPQPTAGWLVTSEVCSLLDHVIEMTTRIRGGDHTFRSRSIAGVAALLKKPREDMQEISVTGTFAGDTPAVKPTGMDNLSPEKRQARWVLAHVMAKTAFGFASKTRTRWYALEPVVQKV